MAETDREARQRHIDEPSDAQAALDATFGAVPRVTVPSRDDWDRG